jgi:hypothetical protein
MSLKLLSDLPCQIWESAEPSPSLDEARFPKVSDGSSHECLYFGLIADISRAEVVTGPLYRQLVI